MSVHVVLESVRRFLSERIEKLSASKGIDVDCNLMLPGFVRRIGIAHQQTRVGR
jgi:hypothetical protein